jgi:hypothetical protein
MPALNFAPGLRMAGRSADIVHRVVGQPSGQLAGDVARPIAGPGPHAGLRQPETVSASVSVTSLAATPVQSFPAMV